MLKRSLLLVLMATLLSSCGLPLPGKPGVFKVEAPLFRQAQLAKMEFWHAGGVFSIVQTDKPSERPEIASFDWQQLNQGYRIIITSALDLYRLEILRQLGSVTLWKNGTEASNAKTPEGLMQKAVGWSLPISELSTWIKAMPVKSSPIAHAKYDEYGHLIGLSQDGWAMRFDVFRKVDDGVDLPHAIVMERPGLKVNIVIKHWGLLNYRGPNTTVMP